MNLIQIVQQIRNNYESGQEIYRRVSVGRLLERISQLEQSAKQGMWGDDLQVCQNFTVARDGKCYNCGFEKSAHQS